MEFKSGFWGRLFGFKRTESVGEKAQERSLPDLDTAPEGQTEPLPETQPELDTDRTGSPYRKCGGLFPARHTGIWKTGGPWNQYFPGRQLQPVSPDPSSGAQDCGSWDWL